MHTAPVSAAAQKWPGGRSPANIAVDGLFSLSRHGAAEAEGGSELLELLVAMPLSVLVSPPVLNLTRGDRTHTTVATIESCNRRRGSGRRHGQLLRSSNSTPCCSFGGSSRLLCLGARVPCEKLLLGRTGQGKARQNRAHSCRPADRR